MNFKKTLFAFFVALPLCVAARIWQIANTIEYKNGFFLAGKETAGWLALLIIALICAVVVLLALKTKGLKVKPFKTDGVFAAASLLAAVTLFFEFLGETMPITMLAWQIFLVKTVTVFTVIYFLALALFSVLGVKVPEILHAVPCVYAIVKTIFEFVNISSLALISDNLLLMLCYCALMLFFINSGKYYIGIEAEKTGNKAFAASLLATLVTVMFSLSTIIINLFGEAYAHTNRQVMYTLLAFGLFSLVFAFKSFGKKPSQ